MSQVDVFAALANPVRRQILLRLRKGPRGVSELAEGFEIGRPAVSEHLQVSWDTIKEIQKQDLQRRFGRPKLKHLRHLAIDEISIGHGHRYLTVVLDLDTMPARPATRPTTTR